MVIAKNSKGSLRVPKELEIRQDDPETSVIRKIFLVESVLFESCIRVLKSGRSSSSSSSGKDEVSYEILRLKTDDILKDPYAFPSIKTEKFKAYFKSFSRFKNLQPNELLQLINLKLYEILPDMFQDNKQEIQDLLSSVEQLKKRLYKDIAVIQVKLSEKTKKSLIDLTPQGKYVYSLLSSIVNLQISGEVIDYLNVIKEIKLSKELPLAHTVNPETFKPLVKVWKGLPKEQLKNFLLSQTNQQAGKANIKRPKGLTFKVSNGSEEYLTPFLSKTKPVLSVRCNWKIEDAASFTDTRSCVKPTSSLVQQIQDIANVSFKPVVDIKYAKVLCKFKQSASIKNILKSFKENKSNLKLVSSTENGITFESGNVSIDLKLVKGDNSMNILVSGTKQESQLFDILDSFVYILDLTNFKTPQKIKEKTVRPFAPNCTAARKPRLARSSEIAKTYHIQTADGKIVCNDNEKYQYPGYTSKNDICCFARDQRKKPNFKGSNTVRKIIFSDENVLAKPVILTDKVLQNGRLGVLPEIIVPYFSDDFNRVGVAEGTLLEAIAYCSNSKFSRKTLEEGMSQQLADSLEIDYHSTLKYLQTEKKLNHQRVLSSIQKIIKKNVIVITETSVFCEEIVDFEFKEFIILYFARGNYEPLVKTLDYKTLQKIFTKKDLLEFFKIYHTSCQIQFTPSNFTPFSYNKLKDVVVVKGQILDKKGKSVFVVTDSGLLPIIKSPVIYKVKTLKLKEVVANASTQMKLLNSIKTAPYDCIGQIVAKEAVVALLTGSKIIVPVLTSRIIPGLPMVEDVEYVEDSSAKSRYSEVNAVETLKKREEYQRSRYDLSEVLKKNVGALDETVRIKKTVSIVYTEKIQAVEKILKELGVKKYLKKLSLDTLNNVEILSGTLRLDSLDSRNFVKRPCEVILATQEELNDYFK